MKLESVLTTLILALKKHLVIVSSRHAVNQLIHKVVPSHSLNSYLSIQISTMRMILQMGLTSFKGSMTLQLLCTHDSQKMPLSQTLQLVHNRVPIQRMTAI